MHKANDKSQQNGKRVRTKMLTYSLKTEVMRFTNFNRFHFIRMHMIDTRNYQIWFGFVLYAHYLFHIELFVFNSISRQFKCVQPFFLSIAMQFRFYLWINEKS